MAAVTTTVSIIGPAVTGAASQLAATASNVSLVPEPALDDDPLIHHDRLLSAWREARRHPPVYTVVPFDPLRVLVEAWAARLQGAPNQLETLIGLTPTVPAPHYYIVDPTIEAPHVHWYHDLLSNASAVRVVTATSDAPALRRAIGDLPTGPELPDMHELAELARDYIPLPTMTTPGSR